MIAAEIRRTAATGMIAWVIVTYFMQRRASLMNMPAIYACLSLVLTSFAANVIGSIIVRRRAADCVVAGLMREATMEEDAEEIVRYIREAPERDGKPNRLGKISAAAAIASHAVIVAAAALPLFA